MSTANYAELTSPRIDPDGVLRFHEGDTFVFPLEIHISDGDTPITIGQDDVITVEFFTENIKRKLASVVFENVENNTVTVEFDKEFSGLFRPKRVIDAGYTFEVRYNDKLIANDGRIEVL